MQYVLVLTVGPVQGFIAAARRSRDLWYGSYMLSELAKAAAKNLHDSGATLIFPAPEQRSDLNPDTKLQAANRIVAIIEGDVRTIAEQAKAQVQQRIQELWSAAQKIPHGNIDQDVADQQIRDLPEIMWVATPLNDNYAAARERVEYLMAARKVTNAFVPVPWPANGQTKSSLDGQREAVIPDKVYPKHQQGHQNKEAYQRALQSLFNIYRVNIGERLSGVDLLKRWGSEKFHVASTSDIAARSLLARINQQDPNMAEAWEMYIRWVKWHLGNSGNEQIPEEHPTIDQYTELLFAERISDYFDPNPVPTEITHYLESFLNTYADKKRPIPYYVMLHADGDQMGVTIDHLAKDGIERHQAFSQALTVFSSNVKGIVEAKQGVLIYAGGDDVLALLPLHTALDCAQELKNQFYELLQSFKSNDQTTPTLSVGLAIAHHVEPLSDTLDLARAAEKIAKKVPGKNALAVTLSKRSGSDRTISGKWGQIDSHLQKLIYWYSQEALPTGMAYELQQLAEVLPFPDANQHAPASRQQIITSRIAEATRIFKRKQANNGTALLEIAVIEYLTEQLSKEAADSTAPTGVLEDIANKLIVARIFADAAELANLPKESQL